VDTDPDGVWFGPRNDGGRAVESTGATGDGDRAVSVGTLAVIPLLVKMAMERINRPESDRAMRRRLRSIRDDSGYRSEVDIY
jgi:hypothetical protein